MYINYLQLKNYRNYQELNIDLSNQVNIFLGNNAQGKTNILEAIHFLALAKSHRTSKDKELVQWGQSFSVIKGSFKTKRKDLNLEIQFTQKGKKAKINNLERRKLSEYIGGVNVILFGPEDLNLVKGSPIIRRRFMDMEISQISTSYIYNLSQFNKVVIQRNNLLKDFTIDNKNKEELLEIWNEQLVVYGAKIISKRINFIKKLEQWANEILNHLTDKTEELTIIYKPSFKIDMKNSETEIIELYRDNLYKIKKQELYRGTTLLGPHRDDIQFNINNINAQSFGSQGQQRSIALSLKLAEIELIYNETGEYPILLLDDVLSELDQKRQTHLLNTIENKVQTIITTTSTDGIDEKTLLRASIFKVKNGTVELKN